MKTELEKDKDILVGGMRQVNRLFKLKEIEPTATFNIPSTAMPLFKQIVLDDRIFKNEKGDYCLTMAQLQHFIELLDEKGKE